MELIGMPRWRKALEAGLFVLGVSLVSVAATFIRIDNRKFWSFWILALGAFVASAALWWTELKPFAVEPVEAPRRRRRIIGGILFALAMASIVAGSVVLARNWQAYFWVIGSWAVSITIAAAGLNLCQGYAVLPFREQPADPERRWTRSEIGWFALIAVLAIFLRCYRLDYFPPRYGVIAIEEPQVGLRAWRILEHGSIPWEFGFGNILTTISFRVFGMNYTGLRVPAIVLSVATVLIFYLLMRELVGRRARVAASVLFAFSAWHLTYSRASHGIFSPVPISVWFYYLLIRTRVNRRLSTFLWLGVASAILMVAYAPFRPAPLLAVLFYVGVGAACLLRWIRGRRQPLRTGDSSSVRMTRKQPKVSEAPPWGLLITVAVTAALFYPMWLASERQWHGYYFEAWHRSGLESSQHKDQPSREVLQQKYERLKKIWSIYYVYPADGGTVALPPGGKLDPISGGIFALALGYLLLSCGKGYNGFFLLVFLLIFHGLGLFARDLVIRRYTALVPVLYVLIGLWLGAVETWSFSRFRLWGRRCFEFLTVAVVGTAGIWNWHLYFDIFIHGSGARMGYLSHRAMMAGVLSEIPPGSRVITLAPHAHDVVLFRSDYAWLVPKGTRGTGCKNTDELFDCLVNMEPGERALLLIQEPIDLDAMEALLREALGCGPFTELRHPDNHWVTIRQVEFVAPDAPRNLEAFRERAHQIENG